MNDVYRHLVIQLKKNELSNQLLQGEILMLKLIACIFLLMIVVTVDILVDA